jgi:hypothetical protein
MGSNSAKLSVLDPSGIAQTTTLANEGSKNVMKNSAGTPPQSSQETTDQILSAYTSRIPDLLKATSSVSSKLAQDELEASKATTGGYNQLAIDSTNNYAGAMADAQNKVNKGILEGSGGDVAVAAKALDDKVNPEYAAIRNKAASQTGNLLDSINLQGLSGGERAEVERSLGKSNTATGNLGLDNATNAVSNAMSFGDRLSQKRQELSGIVNGASGFMATKNGTFNPVQTAFSGPTGAAGNFTATNPTSNGGALQFGQGALGTVGGATSAQNALSADYNWKNSSRYALGDIGANS